jgi:hypothetical protein
VGSLNEVLLSGFIKSTISLTGKNHWYFGQGADTFEVLKAFLKKLTNE